MGVDPGTIIMGFAVLSASDAQLQLLTMDVLKLSSKQDNYQRLQQIHETITEQIKLYKPQQFAIEAPFFGKNVQSMLKLGRAQGVAIAAAMAGNIPVTEYSPKRIKQAVTGNGNADKDQVYKMLSHLMKIPAAPKYFDATDALAVALCHHLSARGTAITNRVKKSSKKSGSWEDFVAQNKDRLRQVT